MIISKTPYRIPLSGGGTDIEFYYKKKGGEFLSISIDQYVYVILLERKIDDNYFIQTSSTEFPNNLKSIKHILVRETLRYFNVKEKLHIGTWSTIPTGTGLGSSSAMMVGLINCINRYKKLNLSSREIVISAYKIERKICNYYGGWQDQIISQYGGLVKGKISKEGKFSVKKIKTTKNFVKNINKNLLLIYTKIKRDSSKVILSQKKRSSQIILGYDKIKSLNNPMFKLLNKNNISNVGNLFSHHWQIKKQFSNEISNKKIDNFYNKIKKNKYITGGKLIGAGGGGFFLVSTPNKAKLISSLNRENLNFLDFNIDNYGSRIIIFDNFLKS